MKLDYSTFRFLCPGGDWAATMFGLLWFVSRNVTICYELKGGCICLDGVLNYPLLLLLLLKLWILLVWLFFSVLGLPRMIPNPESSNGLRMLTWLSLNWLSSLIAEASKRQLAPVLIPPLNDFNSDGWVHESLLSFLCKFELSIGAESNPKSLMSWSSICGFWIWGNLAKLRVCISRLLSWN